MGTIKGNGSNGPAPFLTKTYEMVDDPLTNSMVSWSHIGCSFVVWKPTEFTQYLLPNCFKHSNFSSFVRQLNTYGFRKIHPDQWEFANADFIRGQKSLLMNIQRRKPIHSHSVQGQENISPLTGTERQEFEDEIKQLKHDKAVLESKLKSHGRDKHGFELQTQSLLERLQSVERRQMQLMPFLAQLINKPGLASILIEQLQSDNKKRRISKSDCFRGEQGVEGDQSSPDRFPAPLVNFELIEKSDRSLRFWENVLYEVGGNVGQEASSFGTWSQRSSNNVGKSNASCGDSEHFSSVSHPSSRNSGDVLSSSGLVGCANDAGRPTFSTRHPGGNIRPESPDFDGNFKSGDEEIKEPASETTNPTMVAGANDQFWQYFLTEAPGSSATPEPEHHGERRSTTSGRTSEMMLNSDGRPWWNANCIDNLTKNTGRIVTADTTGSWFCCMTLIGSKLLWSCWPLALTFGIPPAVDGDRHVLHAHLMRNFETFSYSFEIKKGNVLKERANARVDHEISV